MSLLFGNLVQQFVNFSTILANADAGVSGASEQIPAAAANFRSAAAKSASELVYIGVLHAYMYWRCFLNRNTLYRYWIIGLYIRVHEHLGSHRRSQC